MEWWEIVLTILVLSTVGTIGFVIGNITGYDQGWDAGNENYKSQGKGIDGWEVL